MEQRVIIALYELQYIEGANTGKDMWEVGVDEKRLKEKVEEDIIYTLEFLRERLKQLTKE